jgi:predicted membrane metal-binding protein
MMRPTLMINVLLFLIALSGCATSSDLKRLGQETNLSQEQLRQEFNLLRDTVIRVQQELQLQREGKTPTLNRLDQETHVISRDVARTNKAVLLLGETVAVMADVMAEQLSATIGREDKKPKPSQ